MEFANQLILVAAALIALSIFLGLISTRLGAPLLLVFLVIGMLAGEDGPGGIVFNDFQVAFVVGSAALALILFDGGLRTSRDTLAFVLWPSLLLATVGVVVTAALTGAFAAWIMHLSWLEGALVGSMVASTDAAAVFLLLRLRRAALMKRVSNTLEVEAGLNDPMAVFLTIMCVELLVAGSEISAETAAVEFAIRFVVQMGGGALAGIAGGYALLWVVNRVQLASGLYPILATALALLIFSGAQGAGASGFLAVYLTGFILGNRRHRATHLINRFQDGLAWLSQIVLFLMLGLLVTPSQLLPIVGPAVAIAVFLIVVGRPLAVLLCLAPFRYTWRERTFVAWVGLRGAVPIFLGTIPVLSGVEGGTTFFSVIYVVVLASLVLQGWTVAPVATNLGLTLPAQPETPERVDFDLPAAAGHDLFAYTVRPESMTVQRSPTGLPLPPGSRAIFVIRDGTIRNPAELTELGAGDYVLIAASTDQLPAVDALFGTPPRRRGKGTDEAVFGEFAFDGKVAVGALSDFYDFAVAREDRSSPVGEFLRKQLRTKAVVGDCLRIGDVELVVREMDREHITQVGIKLAPGTTHFNALRRLRSAFQLAMKRLAGRLERLFARNA